LASLAARRPLRGVVRDGWSCRALIAAAGGIWLVRNLIVSGSPLFPAKVAPFGITIFDAPRDSCAIPGRASPTLATDGHRWTAYFVPAWRHSLGLTRPLLAARRARPRSRSPPGAGGGADIGQQFVKMPC